MTLIQNEAPFGSCRFTFHSFQTFQVTQNKLKIMMAIFQILIVFTILFGTSTFKLNYSEYVTMLSLMGFHTGVTLFCWMVVFTFRKNLLMTAKYSLAPSQSAGRAAVAFARAGILNLV